MHKLLFVILMAMSVNTYSQTNTYSPYSRFGLGELSRQGMVFNKGMGGTGIGLSLPNSLNFLNPASYTSQDTLSFLFDFGLYSHITRYKTNERSSQDLRASLDHIVIGFPITKWWKTSAGLVPYSRMGYDLVTYEHLPNDIYSYKYTYTGTGGLNKFYFGNAFKLKDLSVGVNLNVLFGALEQTHGYVYDKGIVNQVLPTSRYQRQSIRSTSLTFGFQYNFRLTDDIAMIIGGTFENKSRLISTNELLVTNMFTVNDTLINPISGQPYGFISTIDTINNIHNEVKDHLPLRYGAGISFLIKNKLIIAADYSTQRWSDYKSFNAFDTLVDSRYLNFGVQFTPDEKAIRNYWKKISFRAGFYTTDTYLKIGGHQIKDYGVTMGLRLPFKGNKSAIQLSYEYGKRGTTNHNLLQENYHFINLSVSLYDFWFIQSKYD